jgi:hypothetical protein
MKIKIETTDTITKEFEIELPYYTQMANLFYFKVISETQAIKACSKYGSTINIVDVRDALKELPCTAEEFNVNYKLAMIEIVNASGIDLIDGREV